MKRRLFIGKTLGLSAAAWCGGAWAATDHAAVHRVGAAWRRVSGQGTAQDFVGVLELDWQTKQIRLSAEHVVPSRAHGVMAEANGGFLAIAARPGTWIRRIGAGGEVVQHHSILNEKPARTFAGHVIASHDGKKLYTAETDAVTGEGWVSVRDPQSFAKLNEWRTHGRDPHQCLIDSTGALVLVNGGIARDANGDKRDLDQMNSSLVRLHGQTGELLGQWKLNDHRLSMRHITWGVGENPLLGIALQAEHDDIQQRRAAPVLAVWDGKALNMPCREAVAMGYAGDIAAGPGGGFILSGQRAGKGVLWHPDAPSQFFPMAELKEICALATVDKPSGTGVLLGGELGVAYWHPRQTPAMLAWPKAITLDNHWVLLS